MHLSVIMSVMCKENISEVFILQLLFRKNNCVWLLRCCFLRCPPVLCCGKLLANALPRKDFLEKDFVHRKPYYCVIEITFILC